MSGFGSWRAPRRERPAPDAGPSASSAPSAPAGPPGLPGLPPRRSPSYLDRLRDDARDFTPSQHGTASIYVTFLELMPTRVDAAFYTGIEGRAAICLQLSPAMATSLDDLLPVVRQGANLHVMPWTESYPLLRTVLMLPPPLDTVCESMLVLTEGNVQEFLTDALRTGTVELHIGVAGVSGGIALGCRAHGLAELLGGAVEELCRHDHPADDARYCDAVERAECAYPHVTSGLSRATAVILQPTGHVSGLTMVELRY